MSNGAADIGNGEIAPILPSDMDEIGEHFKAIKMWHKIRSENEQSIREQTQVVSGPACALGGG